MATHSSTPIKYLHTMNGTINRINTAETIRATGRLIILALFLLAGRVAAQPGGEEPRQPNPGTVEMNIDGGGMLRSTDGGASWSIVGEAPQQAREQARSAGPAQASGVVRITSIARAGSDMIIRYDLLQPADITIRIAGVRGCLVIDDHVGLRDPGSYAITIDAAGLVPGGYCYGVAGSGRMLAAGKFLFE